ncbi:MAG: hypothetical protein P1U86_10355, partial [Verrucomicrobiales bacterium]|nr:hypothetical protein [Verrucomicrobiales bacterium]
EWVILAVMMRLPVIVLMLLGSLCEVSPLGAAEELTPSDPFAGGKTEISGADAERASKAIRNWSQRSAWPGEGKAEEAPWFWDYSRVGQRVYIRIIKGGNYEGILEVWLKGGDSPRYSLFKTYRIAYFSGEPGPKTKRGDNQAPEGFYFIGRRAMNPLSTFHLSMDMGYPNAYDRHYGRTGDLLMIHGNAVSIGCFAMTDLSIEQIYTLVDTALKNGQPFVRVHSFPFEMSEENLEARSDSVHYPFWKNLKEGWDWFEENGVPPNVTVEDGLYRFGSGSD